MICVRVLSVHPSSPRVCEQPQLRTVLDAAGGTRNAGFWGLGLLNSTRDVPLRLLALFL